MALPSGMIVLWSGALVDIPAGYALCDGTLGTPNLAGRFIQGAHTGLAPGTLGGSYSHTHTFTTDGHSHAIPGGADIQGGTPWASLSTVEVDTGTTDAATNRPPWYALAYIMKL